MGQDYARRATDGDSRATEIENMIAEENDPDKRVFLIVLNSINNSLVANTQIVQSLKGEFKTHIGNFETHTKDEEAILNQGRGMWKIMAVVLVLLQGAAVYVWNDIRTAIRDGQAADIRIEARMDQLEKGKR